MVCRRGGGGGGGVIQGVVRRVPQLEIPLRAKIRESLDSKIWLEVVHGVQFDFILFKPLYLKIVFIAIFLIFHNMSHSKLEC